MTTIPDSGTTPHERTAQAIRADLQQLVQAIRGFTLLTGEQRRKVNVSGHVDDDFLRSMALLIEAHPEIASLTQVTSAEIRDHLNFSGSYQGVAEELILHGRKMVDTIISERASLGERVLRVLVIARSMNTPAGRDSLIPHLEAIDRDFKRGRRRRVTKKPPDDLTAAARAAAVKT
jgi:hypothetical protein